MSVLAVEDRRLTGIGLMLVAYLLFTAIDSSAKWLVLAGLPTMVVVFVRYLVPMVLVGTYLIVTEGRAAFRTENPGLVALRALFLLASTIFNFTAVQYLPLTLTAAIFFTVPLWVCALSIPLLGEKVGPRRWAAIVIGFIGVLVAMRPWSAEAHWAVLLSMGTAIAAALYLIATRRLAGRVSTDTQQFYAAAIAAVAIAPLALAEWEWPASTIDWTVFALIGLFGWGGHQVLTVAHRLAPASVLAPFVYVQMIYMTGSSWLIFDQPPDGWILAGGSIVLASGLYVWLRERALGAG